jgi:hypothetical protein
VGAVTALNNSGSVCDTDIQMLLGRKGKLAAIVNFAVEGMGSHLGKIPLHC